jgi:proline dehydrogenase
MRLWQRTMIALARHQSLKAFMQSRGAMSEFAKRFVGGRDVAEAAATSAGLYSKGYRTSLYYLGESVEDLSAINRTVSELKAIVAKLADLNLETHVSVDPAQIGWQVSEDVCRTNARSVAEEIRLRTTGMAASSKNLLMLNMEDSSVTTATVGLYETLRCDNLPVAVTLQAYLFRSEADLGTILQNGDVVRLVKGAFAENSSIAFSTRSEVAANYRKLASMMLSDEARRAGSYPVFATHDATLMNDIVETASRRGWRREEYEFEMLFGVRRELQERLIQDGMQLRLYLPFGKDWWPYAVRRVGESPRNVNFLLSSLVGK